MNHATTPEGTAMVVLTREEYDRLIADHNDIVDGALADAARGNDRDAPTLPGDVLTEVMSGAIHPLTAWRGAARLSMAALAERAQIRPATISDIENGKLDPRFSTLRAIASALRLDVDDIMPPVDHVG